jgi:SAM-dependent methyltransferase
MTTHPDYSSVAETYARLRPGYPPEVFEDIVALTDLPDDATILEIGPATGQATLPLAQRGYRITGIEADSTLAAQARRSLASFPNVEFHVSRFEDWRLPPEPFDLVLSASAFHWIDPAVRFVKSASALNRGGHLAVIHTYHVRGGTDAFFDEVQSCYRDYMPADAPTRQLRSADAIAPSTSAYEASGLFTAPQARHYTWQQTYTARVYTDFLSTYPDHIALPEATRRDLLDCIASLIEDRYGGSITRQYLTELVIARKR